MGSRAEQQRKQAKGDTQQQTLSAPTPTRRSQLMEIINKVTNTADAVGVSSRK